MQIRLSKENIENVKRQSDISGRTPTKEANRAIEYYYTTLLPLNIALKKYKPQTPKKK